MIKPRLELPTWIRNSATLYIAADAANKTVKNLKWYSTHRCQLLRRIHKDLNSQRITEGQFATQLMTLGYNEETIMSELIVSGRYKEGEFALAKVESGNWVDAVNPFAERHTTVSVICKKPFKPRAPKGSEELRGGWRREDSQMTDTKVSTDKQVDKSINDTEQFMKSSPPCNRLFTLSEDFSEKEVEQSDSEGFFQGVPANGNGMTFYVTKPAFITTPIGIALGVSTVIGVGFYVFHTLSEDTRRRLSRFFGICDNKEPAENLQVVPEILQVVISFNEMRISKDTALFLLRRYLNISDVEAETLLMPPRARSQDF